MQEFRPREEESHEQVAEDTDDTVVEQQEEYSIARDRESRNHRTQSGIVLRTCPLPLYLVMGFHYHMKKQYAAAKIKDGWKPWWKN